MPKITNIKVSKKKPSVYLKELECYNKDIEKCLNNHLTPQGISTGLYDDFYTVFLEDRAKIIFELINKHVLNRSEEIFEKFYQSPALKSTGNIKVFSYYYKKRLDATFDIETKKILFNGNSYSLSQAANVAKQTISGRDDTSTNGWQFWNYIDEDGKTKPINDFRRE